MGQHVVVLARSTGVQAQFGPEGRLSRFSKLFSKELQTGDSLFDEHVHVNTETEELTSKLLESTDVRTVIERVISDGGSVAIEDKQVTFELPDGVDLDPALKSAFLAAVDER